MDEQHNELPPPDIDSKIAAERRVATHYTSYDPDAKVYKPSFFTSAWSSLTNMQHPMLVVGIVVASLLLAGGVVMAMSMSGNSNSGQELTASEDGTDENPGKPRTGPKTVLGEDGLDVANQTDSSIAASTGDIIVEEEDEPVRVVSGGKPPTPPSPPPPVDDDVTPYPDPPIPNIPDPPVPPTPQASVKKVLIFVEENHSFAQMKNEMPYAFGLGQKFGYANSYYGIRSPSLPNYMAIAGGSTFGITTNGPPSQNGVKAASIFGQALSSGKSARLYAEGMPGNCVLSDGGDRYRVKHNPWAYFLDERVRCRNHDVPASQLAADAQNGKLPHVGMVIPNVCHNAHNCSLSVADRWFKIQMRDIFAGPDWKSGKLAVILTADEDDRKSGNRVLTVVIHPSQSGRVVTSRLNHYSLSRLASEVVGAQPLREAKTAPSMSGAFGLPL